jgi:hypothetical protein
MNVCITCKTMLGLHRVHDTECPVRMSLWCTQCSCFGHLAKSCDDVVHVWRPATLEELIPADVLARWNISTTTRIHWKSPVTLDDAEREIHDINSIDIRFKEGKQDNRIREIMRSLKIPTVHKMDENIRILREWAVKNGKKVRILQESDNGGQTEI